MSRLVDRWGRTKFAAITSLAWALPMAAWAGSVDLQPGPGPWVAFGVGLVVLAGWLVLLTRLGGYPVTPRPRRLDFKAMSPSERRWSAGLFLFAVGIIGWLNGAATVDWSILTTSITAGHPGPIALAFGLALLLVLLVAGAVVTWRGSSAAFRRRSAAA
ncbi:MAG TPA: hypothetical protein VNG93_14265 [Candidatus Dormibacteraeota bacterium]|nr:hypothetical protein [Candidatus Dormibacteraeota bacterium]